MADRACHVVGSTTQVGLTQALALTDMISATETDPATLLRQLFVGASVSGVRFGALQLLFSPASGAGELYINLSSAFQIFDSRPDSFPAIESEVAELTEEGEILSLFDLRAIEITQVEIVDPAGHLAVTFVNGAVLYVNGNNSGPEPWQAGLNALDRSDSIWVLAISGCEPIVYRPLSGEL